jgi:hypothetical protein
MIPCRLGGLSYKTQLHQIQEFVKNQLSTVNCQLRGRARGHRPYQLPTNYAFLIAKPFKYSSGLSGSNLTPSKKVSIPREVVAGI